MSFLRLFYNIFFFYFVSIFTQYTISEEYIVGFSLFIFFSLVLNSTIAFFNKDIELEQIRLNELRALDQLQLLHVRYLKVAVLKGTLFDYLIESKKFLVNLTFYSRILYRIMLPMVFGIITNYGFYTHFMRFGLKNLLYLLEKQLEVTVIQKKISNIVLDDSSRQLILYSHAIKKSMGLELFLTSYGSFEKQKMATEYNFFDFLSVMRREDITDLCVLSSKISE